MKIGTLLRHSAMRIIMSTMYFDFYTPPALALNKNKGIRSAVCVNMDSVFHAIHIRFQYHYHKHGINNIFAQCHLFQWYFHSFCLTFEFISVNAASISVTKTPVPILPLMSSFYRSVCAFDTILCRKLNAHASEYNTHARNHSHPKQKIKCKKSKMGEKYRARKHTQPGSLLSIQWRLFSNVVCAKPHITLQT